MPVQSAANMWSAMRRQIFDARRHVRRRPDAYGLSQQNHTNIVHGYEYSRRRNAPPSAFEDYGHDAQRRGAAAVIGDGKGAAPFLGSLAVVNADEPPPPSWPPEASAPVRYLSSYRVRP